jgi:hypothetical protein
MNTHQNGLKNTFNRLHELILKERDAAKSLNIDVMLALNDDKKELVTHLEDIPREELDEECLMLADKIRVENRRNAYFYLNALQWLRQSIDFWGEKLYFRCYGKNGNMTNRQLSGNILSGKV